MSPRRPNFYADGGIERESQRRNDETWLAAQLAHPATRVLPVWRTHSFVVAVDEAQDMPRLAALSVEQVRPWLAGEPDLALLGLWDDVAHFTVDVSHLEDPHDDGGPGRHGRFVDLRDVGPVMQRQQAALLAYARGIAYWHSRHRFCGVCGAPTRSMAAGHQRRCLNPDCAADHFPRTDPAVIMLVHDGDRVVMGRQSFWPAGMHSVLAGFVEPGECLEDAVAREVKEEVGIEVSQVRYHSSQPWPFPASIMLGFTARAAPDELTVFREELENARWFTREELLASPEDETLRLPRRDSIARRLVDDWLQGEAD